jgi:hypothetical protein
MVSRSSNAQQSDPPPSPSIHSSSTSLQTAQSRFPSEQNRESINGDEERRRSLGSGQEDHMEDPLAVISEQLKSKIQNVFKFGISTVFKGGYSIMNYARGITQGPPPRDSPESDGDLPNSSFNRQSGEDEKEVSSKMVKEDEVNVSDVKMEDNECIICVSQPSNAVLYKCGHICMCYQCAKAVQIQARICPICREPISDVIKCFKNN